MDAQTPVVRSMKKWVLNRPAHAPVPLRRLPGTSLVFRSSPYPHLQPGPARSVSVMDGSAVGISAGKSRSPIWLLKAASTVDSCRMRSPSSSPPRSSARSKRM